MDFRKLLLVLLEEGGQKPGLSGKSMQGCGQVRTNFNQGSFERKECVTAIQESEWMDYRAQRP